MYLRSGSRHFWLGRVKNPIMFTPVWGGGGLIQNYGPKEVISKNTTPTPFPNN